MTTFALNNLWTYLQGLSLSQSDREWLANKLVMPKESEPEITAEERKAKFLEMAGIWSEDAEGEEYYLLCLIPLLSATADTGIVTASALNVRSSASTDSNVVGVVHEGDKVTIKDSNGNWYRISCNGKTGYVWKKYIKVSSSGSSSSRRRSSRSRPSPLLYIDRLADESHQKENA